MTPPMLSTERLTLRGHLPGDFASYADMMAAPEARFMGGPYDRRAAWGMFANDNATWVLHGFGSWAVLKGGSFIGQVSIQWPDHFAEPEFGWMLAATARGQGHATEAAEAALSWVWANTALTSIVSHIHPDNKASMAVAARLGGQPDPDAWRDDPEDIIYRHRRAA
ncbi:MAG: GNAT family N-acetyltransferase [Pseudomonadota bacterium]